MRTHRPTISVIIPNYNHSALVGRAIASILAQNDDVLELIVVDDASTDESVPVIEAAIGGRANARLIRNARNQGIVATLAHGLREASGDFVLLGSADDVYLPCMMAMARKLAASHPDVGLICGDAIVREEGRPEQRVHLPFGGKARFIASDEVASIIRRRNFTFFTGAALLRRDAVMAAGGLTPELQWHCDWLLDFVLALRHGVCYVPQPFAVFHVGPECYSQGRFDWTRQRRVLTEVIVTLAERYPDVMPLFRNGALLPSYERALLPELLADPQVRFYLTPLLIWRLLVYKLLSRASGILPRDLVQRLRPLLRV
jgi:cellulose synthase/poly-beta-1,6-N-acetylglucosamine synthase-like glycosyltransferase